MVGDFKANAEVATYARDGGAAPLHLSRTPQCASVRRKLILWYFQRIRGAVRTLAVRAVLMGGLPPGRPFGNCILEMIIKLFVDFFEKISMLLSVFL